MDDEQLRALDPGTPLRESIAIRSAKSERSVKVCEELRAVLHATNTETLDGASARALERAFNEAKRAFSFVRYYRERYDDESGTYYSFGRCPYAEELQDAITRLYYDFEPVIHAIAARFKWQPDQVANLFRKPGSKRYVLAWSVFIAAAEVRTMNQPPATIEAPQLGFHGPVANAETSTGPTAPITKPAIDDDAEFTEPIAKSIWCVLLKCSKGTLRNRLGNGTYRMKPGTLPTAKLVALHIDGLPRELKARHDRKRAVDHAELSRKRTDRKT